MNKNFIDRLVKQEIVEVLDHLPETQTVYFYQELGGKYCSFFYKQENQIYKLVLPYSAYKRLATLPKENIRNYILELLNVEERKDG